MEQEVREKGERFKVLAEIFLKENKKVFIKDYSDNYYFGEVILIGESSITFYCFGPDKRAGKNITLYWPVIKLIEEYEDRE